MSSRIQISDCSEAASHGSPPPETISGGGPIRVLIVSSHTVFRECLKAMMAYTDRFRVGDSRDCRREVEEKVESMRPDVLLVDLHRFQKHIVELVRGITRRFPDLPVIALGVNELDPDVLRCIEVGARGYVSRESSFQELSQAIDLAVGGRAVCPPRLASSAFSLLAELSGEVQRRDRVEALQLSPRELEILQLIAEGLSNKSIAVQLCLSVYTVKNHVHRILEKLQVPSREEAVEYATKKRWIRRRRCRCTCKHDYRANA